MLTVEIIRDGKRAGPGPLRVLEAVVRRTLDGPGQISLELAYTAEAERALTPRAQFVLYRGGDTEIAAGVLRTIRRTGLSGRMLVATATDALEALGMRSVLVARSYPLQGFAQVVQDLAGIAGWQAQVDETDLLIEARFDGVSVLKAIQQIIRQQGWHFRLRGEKTIEVSTFKREPTLTLYSVDSGLAGEAAAVAYLREVQIERDGENIVNWVLPLGSGEGEAALTLEKSTRGGIQTQTGADGRTLYYVSDAESIAEYGVQEKVITFKEIAPLSNSEAGKAAAANLLYDAARAWLDEHKAPVTRVTARITPVSCRLLPGDRVRVNYAGPVRHADGEAGYEALDGVFSVISVSETYNRTSAPTLQAELATIPRTKEDAAQKLVEALETLSVRNLRPVAFPYWSENTYLDTVQSTGINPPVAKVARFMLEIDNAVTDLHRVRLRVRTRPLHTNVIAYTPQMSTQNANATSPHNHQILAGWVMQMRGGVAEGTAYPAGLSIIINGINRTAELGGPWNPPPTNAPLDISLDITEYIRNASGGMYRDHSIEFTCAQNTADTAIVGGTFNDTLGGSQGIVELNIRIQGTAMAIISG